MLPLARPGLWLAGAALLALAIAVGSLLPGAAVAPVAGYDKIEHVAAYLLLAAWLTGLVAPRHYPSVALATVLFGVGLELAQGAFTATREAEWADVAANAAGTGAALLVAWLGGGGWALRVERWLGWRRR